MVAVPVVPPGLTRPFWSTVTMDGSLLSQVMAPVEPAGEKVTFSFTGSGYRLLRLNSLRLRVKPVAVCPAGISPVLPPSGLWESLG